MAPPMLEFAICCMSMMKGNTSEMPASACEPSRPMKCASTVAVMAIRTTFTTTLGAARRSRVEMIGASRRTRVRAAIAGFPAFAGGAEASVVLRLLMSAPCPRAFAGLEQRLDGASWEAGRLQDKPDDG